jgi:HK97 family phage portal protein
MAVRLDIPRLGIRRRDRAIEQRSFVSQEFGPTSLEYINAAFGDNRLPFDPAAELNAYQASEVIYRCVDLISTELAGLDLVLIKDDGAGQEYIQNDPLANLFNKASEDADNAVARKRIMWAQLEMHGECFIYMDRGATAEGVPTDFAVIMSRVIPRFAIQAFDDAGNPRELSPREKLAPKVIGFMVQTRWGQVDLLPSEVLWLRYPHFKLPWAPMAPSEAARTAASLDREARAWQMGELQNGARPSGVMRLGAMSREEAERNEARANSKVAGAANAGRILYVYGQDKPGFDRIGLTPAEMGYLESHATNGKDICTGLGIPVDLIFGQSTFNNQDAAWSRLWSGLLVGKKKLVEAEIDRTLFPDPGLRAVFDVRNVSALQENTDALHDRTIKAHDSDITTLEEARAKIGLEPFGDERDNMTLTQYRAWVNHQYAPPQVPIAALPADPNAPAPPPNDAQRMAAITLPDSAVTVTDVAREVGDALGVNPGDSAAPASVISMDVAAIQRAYDRHEMLIARRIQELAAKQRTMTLRNLDKAQRKRGVATEQRITIDPTSLFNAAFWVAETVKALFGQLDDLWTSSAATTADALGAKLTDVFLERVVAEMKARLNVLSGQITQTTYDAISAEVLKEGVEQGEGTSQLADRLKERFTDLETWRAETIARTEVVSGHSQASFFVAKESGVVASKEWLATHDDRVRDTHKRLNGDRVGMDSRFSNGLLFPGDPTGPPSQVINCRCILLFGSEKLEA